MIKRFVWVSAVWQELLPVVHVVRNRIIVVDQLHSHLGRTRPQPTHKIPQHPVVLLVYRV